MSDLKKYKLCELGILARGKSKHRPRDASHLYGGPYPFIQTGDVRKANHKIVEYSQTYSEAGLLQSKLWDKGTICITIAANIAETGILTFPACFPDSVLGFVPNSKICNTDYIEYMLQYFKSDVQKHSIGSVQENINLSTFQNIEFPIPDLPTQTRIAAILSSLDDKIELNRRTNATLEAMAQTLFKKYFVDDIDAENLPAGKAGLPKGWRWGKLGEIYKTTSGGTPSRANPEYYEGGNIGWVKSKELDGGFIIETEEKITVEGLKNSSAKLLPLHSVLVAMYGATVGEIAVLSVEATCNQAICAILPNEDYPFSFVLQFLKLNKEDLVSRASGSAQQNISQLTVQNFDLAIPPSSLVKEYHEVSGDMLMRIEANLQENRYLMSIRDSLLPKLISGEIEVNAAENALVS